MSTQEYPTISAIFLDRVALQAVLQRFANSILSPGRGALLVRSPVGLQSSTLLHQLDQSPARSMPFVCLLWCPLFLAGCSSRRGVWGHTTVSCTSAREPGWSSCPLVHVQGNVNNGPHWFLLSEWFLQLLETSHVPALLYAVPLSCVCEKVLNWLRVVSQKDLL